MDIALTLKAVAALSGAGLMMALALTFASKKFHVEEDPKVVEVLEKLPGGNCGACGLPGCRAAAESMVKGDIDVNACTAGGQSVAEAIGAMLGKEVTSTDPAIATLICRGGTQKVKSKFDYAVLKDCDAAHSFAGGPLECGFGCLGYGNCEKDCPFDAISMVDGLPSIDPEKCTACGICVKTCPRGLFSLLPKKGYVYVGCGSLDKGKDVRKICKVGCIACNACVKVCESDAIKVENNVAIVDQEKCTGCMKCVEKCPTKCIYEVNCLVEGKSKAAVSKEQKPFGHCSLTDE